MASYPSHHEYVSGHLLPVAAGAENKQVYYGERGGSRVLSEENFVKLPYLLYVFGQTGLNKQYRLREDAAEPQNAASDQGLFCFPFTQQFNLYS